MCGRSTVRLQEQLGAFGGAQFRGTYLTPRVSPHPVAAGFGEFQPIETEKTEEALTRNRRIELKLTER
jgi:hypothetical protein